MEYKEKIFRTILKGIKNKTSDEDIIMELDAIGYDIDSEGNDEGYFDGEQKAENEL